MSRTFSSTTIAYGAILPPPNSMADGSLFFKTAPDPGGANPLGLYIFNFQQDINPNVVGDQIGSGWQIAANTIANGAVIQGDVTVGGTDNKGGVTIVNSTTVDPGSIIFTNNTNTTIGSVGWDITQLSLLFSGNWMFENVPTLVGGGSFWTSDNDGAASGLDSDLLDGQQGSYYLDLANSTGTLDLATKSTGTLAVANGGTGITVAVAGGIHYGSSASTTAFTSAGIAGQILQSNGVLAPVWVNTSSISIGTATASTNLQGGTAGAIPVQTAPNTTSFISAGTTGYVLTSTGTSSAPTWQSAGSSGATIVDVTNVPATTHYLTFTSATSGSLSTADISSTQLIFVPSTGTLSSPNFNSLSDRRAKTNIRSLGYGLKEVMRMEGRKFEMIANGKSAIGFIAQDMQYIIPEAVDKNTDDRLGINYQILTAVLVEAMKEQQKQISNLTALVAKLIDI